MKLKDIAGKINEYLKRFEADAKINKPSVAGRISPYYMSSAWSAGRYVQVRYISFQGVHSLTREQAEKYLAFLEQGGVGKHHRAGVE